MGLLSRAGFLGIYLLGVSNAFANCGSAFCSINTNNETQFDSITSGLSVNARSEFVDLDQPRQGTTKVGARGEPGGHDELETTNQNFVLGLEYVSNSRWRAGLQIPFLKRYHAHIHNPNEVEIAAGEAAEREEWNLSGLGDIYATGGYEWELGSVTIGGHGGLKLPTGVYRATNDAGEEAERTLQLGTGSTDVLASLFAKGKIGDGPVRWFVQTQWQHAIASKDRFRPGDEITFDVGIRYLLSDSFSANLQLNTRYKRRDSGDNSESDESGGKYVYLSPGVSYIPWPGFQIYGFIQVPMSQNVNGVQLTPSKSIVAGVSYRF